RISTLYNPISGDTCRRAHASVTASVDTRWIYVVWSFFADPATTGISNLSLHDALPICRLGAGCGPGGLPADRGGHPDRHHLQGRDRKSTRLNSSHVKISYAVFCLKKKN